MRTAKLCCAKGLIKRKFDSKMTSKSHLQLYHKVSFLIFHYSIIDLAVIDFGIVGSAKPEAAKRKSSLENGDDDASDADVGSRCDRETQRRKETHKVVRSKTRLSSRRKMA